MKHLLLKENKVGDEQEFRADRWEFPWRCPFTQNILIQMSPGEAAAGGARMEKNSPNWIMTLGLFRVNTALKLTYITRFAKSGVSVCHLNMEQGLKSSIFVKQKTSRSFQAFSSVFLPSLSEKTRFQFRLNYVCRLRFFFLLLFLAITFHLEASTPPDWCAVPRGVFWVHSRVLWRHRSAQFNFIIDSTSLILY